MGIVAHRRRDRYAARHRRRAACTCSATDSARASCSSDPVSWPAPRARRPSLGARAPRAQPADRWRLRPGSARVARPPAVRAVRDRGRRITRAGVRRRARLGRWPSRCVLIVVVFAAVFVHAQRMLLGDTASDRVPTAGATTCGSARGRTRRVRGSRDLDLAPRTSPARRGPGPGHMTPTHCSLEALVAPRASRETGAVAPEDLEARWAGLQRDGYRLALVAAHDDRDVLRIVYLFTAVAPDRRVELVVDSTATSPACRSLARHSFPAGRFEREMRDLFGVEPVGPSAAPTARAPPALARRLASDAPRRRSDVRSSPTPASRTRS